MACQAAMEACLESKEPASLERVRRGAWEVHKEEAAVKTFGAQKKRHGDRHPAVGRRRQPKKRTQDNGGSQKKLAATRRQMTRCAGVAWHKGHSHTGPMVKQRRWKRQTRDGVAGGTSRGRTFGKWRQAQSKCNNGIRNQGLNERLCLGSRRTPSKTFRQTVGLEIVKRTVKSLVGIRKTIVRTLWRSQPPLKQKETANGIRVMDVGA
jgi:hypothetical protein